MKGVIADQEKQTEDAPEIHGQTMTPSTPVASPSLSAGCSIRSTMLTHRRAAN